MDSGTIKIQNRFAELLAAHERKTGRRWTYDDVSIETGIAPSTLSAYAQNKVRRFDAITIERLLMFLGVGVADFFVVTSDPDNSEKKFEDPVVLAFA